MEPGPKQRETSPKKENKMRRIVARVLPSGEQKNVQPFHVSMEGLEQAVLCRDDEDYDVMVKYIAICARRRNVIVIIYAVVSNHSHVSVLAVKQQDADSFARELKRVYSQWFSAKYKERNILLGVDVKAITLDNDWHVRNALAYIPRNAMDNGQAVQDYPWSGFRAMFSQEKTYPGSLRVAALTKRGKDALMHTRDNLSDVPWLLDREHHLVPASFCDAEYLEQAFNHDQAFFLKTVGGVNVAEMKEKLVEGPRRMLPDSEMFQVVADLSRQWFSADIAELPREKKFRLLSYVQRTRKTTVNQLARIFGLERETVRESLQML